MANWQAFGEKRFVEFVVELVRQGVCDGYVVLDKATGLARAIDPNAPTRSKDESVELFKQRQSTYFASMIRERQSRASRVQCSRRVDDLNSMLRLGIAQVTAFRALGLDMEQVPTFQGMLANDVCTQFAVIAHGDVVPKELLARHLPIFDSLNKHQTKHNIPLWILALEHIFEQGLYLDGGAESPLMMASIVLDLLRDFCSDVPIQLQTPSREQVREAGEFLSTLRVNSLNLDCQPKTSRRGMRLSPWAAMTRFVAYFGLTAVIPARKKDRKGKRLS